MTGISGRFAPMQYVALVLLVVGAFGGTQASAQIPAGCRPSAVGIQFADVGGDHKAAAIATGLEGITVRRSDATRFLPNEYWTADIYYGTDVTGRQNIFFADVDGDGRADAIAANKNEIAVRLSDGTQFLAHSLWIQGPFFGSLGGHANNYFADVTGDGKADAIVVNPSGITVRPSDGTRFLPNELWTREPYYGGLGTFFADVTGDGKADAIVVNRSGITVRRSDGRRFLPNELWTRDPYFGDVGDSVYFADVNGDGKADAIVVNTTGITVRLSDGSRFLPPQIWVRHPYYGAIATDFVDVDGDGKADAVAVNRNGIFVRLSNGERFMHTQPWTQNPFYADLAPVCGK
ncbi:MAG: FG-GAP repeat domain-containing protein [Actinomycetota bacterium]